LIEHVADYDDEVAEVYMTSLEEEEEEGEGEGKGEKEGGGNELVVDQSLLLSSIRNLTLSNDLTPW